MNLDTDSLRRALGPDAVESASKIVLGTGALAVVLALASLLPGVDLLIPRTPVTLTAVVGALVTVAVVALLLYLASGLAALTRLELDGPAELVEHVASVVHWLVVFAAVLVAHAGLAPAVTPLFDDARWVYDVAFLLLALGPLAIVAARLYVTVDPLAELAPTASPERRTALTPLKALKRRIPTTSRTRPGGRPTAIAPRSERDREPRSLPR